MKFLFFSVRSVVMNIVALSSSIILTTGLQLVVKKISENSFPPQVLMSIIDNPLMKTMLLISSSRKNSSIVSTLKEGGAVFGSDSSIDAEWNLLNHLVDRICLIFFLTTTVIYHC